MGNFVIAAKSMSKADPFVPSSQGKDTFEYDISSGTTVQLANFLSSKLVCTWQGFHPASDVNAAFTGQAHDMECQAFNNNGVLTFKAGFAYLMDYGIALTMHRTSSTYNTTFKVVSVTIE